MSNKEMTPYSGDLGLFKQLGLKPFSVSTNAQTFVGKVDNEHWSVKVWVECHPAQFWRFEVYNKESEKVVYKINTGSGNFTYYWGVIKTLVGGLLDFEVVEDVSDKEYNSFVNELISFGSFDIKTAIDTALEVEESGEWAAEQVRDFAESCDMSIDDCDPVYCVYEAILQEARNEIDNLTGFDFCNDGAEIYTHGNYIATSYDWSDEAPNKIKDVLVEDKIKFDDLSKKTQWFLEQIEVNY